MKHFVKFLSSSGAFVAAAILIVAFASSSAASDLPRRAPAKLTAQGTPCLPTDCTGPYFGGNIMGIMTSADVLGQGVQNSLAGGGQSLGVEGGYQFANGQYFFAGEAFADYTVNGKPIAAGGPTPTAILGQGIKLGASLAAMFGPVSAAPTPSGLPSTILANTISPYVQFGIAERAWGDNTWSTGWYSGAGMEWAVTQSWFLHTDYMHVIYGSSTVAPGQTLKTEDLVRVGLDYKF